MSYENTECPCGGKKERNTPICDPCKAFIMSYETTSCPCGGKKTHETMICSDCVNFINPNDLAFCEDHRIPTAQRRAMSIRILATARHRSPPTLSNKTEKITGKVEATWQASDARRQNEMGNMCYYGDGMSEDKEQAKEWWMLAAAQGHAEAQNALDVSASAQKADEIAASITLIRLQAIGGDREAQILLAQSYEHGRHGLAVDLHMSTLWRSRANERRTAEADVAPVIPNPTTMTRDKLDEILHQCYSVEIFPEEAAELIWGKAFEGETEKIQSFAEKALLYKDWLKQADLQLTEDQLPPTPTQPQ
jgi:hypothetical protein